MAELSSGASHRSSGVRAEVGGSAGGQIALGVLTLAIGLMVMFWPGPTVVVLAMLVGLQLIVAGVYWLVTAFREHAGGGGRVLLIVVSAVSILGGLLCVFAPFRTAAVLVLLLGLAWLLGGVLQVVHGFSGAGGWSVFSGLLSVLIGIIVLVYPATSVKTLAWLLGVVLVIYGVVTLLGVMAGRRGGAAKPDPFR